MISNVLVYFEQFYFQTTTTSKKKTAQIKKHNHNNCRQQQIWTENDWSQRPTAESATPACLQAAGKSRRGGGAAVLREGGGGGEGCSPAGRGAAQGCEAGGVAGLPDGGTCGGDCGGGSGGDCGCEEWKKRRETKMMENIDGKNDERISILEKLTTGKFNSSQQMMAFFPTCNENFSEKRNPKIPNNGQIGLLGTSFEVFRKKTKHQKMTICHIYHVFLVWKLNARKRGFSKWA